MTSTPPDALISDSWVDLTGQASPIFPRSPRRITPVPFGGEQDYLRMLREAQRESNRSSTKVSPISSALMSLSSTGRNTPSISPKSPPNSPNPELASLAEELKDVYINRITRSSLEEDIVWDWSSRPNIPSKEWKFLSSGRSRNASSSSQTSPLCHPAKMHQQTTQQQQHLEEATKSHPTSTANKIQKKKKGGFFSKDVVYTLLITNLLSLILGAGIGVWLSKRGGASSSKMLVPITASNLL